MLKISFYFLLVLFILFWTNNFLFSQEINKIISGKVIDGQTLSPLPFASVTFPNINNGIATDKNGYFKLSNRVNSTSLIINYVGYKSLTVDLQNFNYEEEHVFTLLPINIYLQEITIYAKTKSGLEETNISELSIQSEKLKDLAGGMPDILRSVQFLPGITVNNEFKANYNVRGGNQDENLVLVNGAVVYEPFHIKEAANASVGIFNVDLIQKADLITGGFSARYGDKMSSVLNIQYREGNKNNFTGSASISLAYLDGYVEGPITNNSSFILGIRKSYLKYITSIIDYEDISSMKPDFYDIQGVLNYNFSPSNKILLEFIHAGDVFTYVPSRQNYYTPVKSPYQNQEAEFRGSKTENEDYNASYYSNLFDIQSINALSGKALLKSEISYYDQTDDEYRLFLRNENLDIDIQGSQTDYYNYLQTQRLTYDSLSIKTLEVKTDFAYQFSPKYEIDLGAGFQSINYNQVTEDIYAFISRENLDDPTVEKTDTIISRGEFGNGIPVDVNSYKYNAYIENIFQLNPGLTFNIGGRVDYFDLNKDLTFSPRISAGYNLSDENVIKAAWGHYYQSPIYRQLKSSIASDTNTQSQMAIHYILGFEHTVSLSELQSSYIKLKAEAYYKNYRNLISSYFGTFDRLIYSSNNDAVGYSKGIDINAVISIPQFYFWLSYGLLYARERKTTDDIGEYPRYTDQRHTLSFVTTIDPGDNWKFTFRGVFGSGLPYTLKTAVFLDGRWEWKSEGIHSAHLPAYKRVDLRISKDFAFSSSSLNIFIDVSNVFNFKNIQSYEYKTPGFSKPTAETILLWPIVPNLGISYKF